MPQIAHATVLERGVEAGLNRHRYRDPVEHVPQHAQDAHVKISPFAAVLKPLFTGGVSYTVRYQRELGEGSDDVPYLWPAFMGNHTPCLALGF
jgi:hypothetical protein